MRGISRSLQSILLATALTGGALPAAAAECGPLKLVASLKVTMLPSGLPAIPAMIGDRPQALVVDTGSAFGQVTRRTVRELNLTTSAPRRVGLRGSTGGISDRVVRLPAITIGNMRQENVNFFVSPEPDDPNDKTPAEFAGFIGSDFLQGFDVELDFAANKLNLFSPDHCEGKVVYWQAPAVAVVPVQVINRVGQRPIGLRTRRPIGSVIQRQEQGDIAIQMELDGKRVDAVLDTGVATTSLDLDVARSQFNVDVHAPDVEKAGELKGGFTATVYRRRFKTLTFEGVTVANPMLELEPNLVSSGVRASPRTGSLLPRDTAPLVLGMSTLSKLHVYIAYKERKLYITAANPGPAVAPAPAK
jgi:predicted aspartyl protease